MQLHKIIFLALCWAVAAFDSSAIAAEGPDERLADTNPLTWTDDFSARMMDGAHRFAEARIERSLQSRQRSWQRDFSSRPAYERSVEPNRERFRKLIGAVDPRVPVVMERFGDENHPALVAETKKFRVYQVRWSVLDGVSGEGLLLEPKGKIVGHIVALPDADQTPEQVAGLVPGVAPESQFARQLAESGFVVIVPVLINRSDEWSGNASVAFTNQPHREWIYRQAYHMGRHIIGYEVQKVLAAVDWFVRQRHPGSPSTPAAQRSTSPLPIGVAGYGEGGLIALYAAAVDTRIDAALASGYFNSRQRLWAEPIYRNVFGLLHEFGDAEIATLIAPRGLVIEYSEVPKVTGPPPVRPGRRGGAAVGALETPPFESVAAEFGRIDTLIKPGFQPKHLVHGAGATTIPFGSQPALEKFAQVLGIHNPLTFSTSKLSDQRTSLDPAPRQKRQVQQLEEHVQRLLRGADRVRDAFFLTNTTVVRSLESRGERFRKYRIKEQSADVFAQEAKPFRQYFQDEIMGRLDEPMLPPNARARKIYDREKWTGYEVVLDVYPDVFAWGVLLVPKDLKPGERRAVVVCQHGRNGLPKEVIEGDNAYYHNFAARLAEQGFVTFAPHNLYRGEDRYRILNRKANATRATMFSFIIAQHDQLLNWLQTLPFIDPQRIAFYGLSYGGETAMRVPAILERYCLSICSGDFNDWARKVASTDSDYSFMFTVEWEMPYFNMGSTFNYAELAYLIAPRPFMVERGHHDGVAPNEWVAYEYGKVRWLYAQLGLADKTEIEFYNGGHTINGEGTFRFLHQHLKW